MSQPAPYSPSNSFQAELGTSFGTNLDREFRNISLSVDEIETNLALIQRDDGSIRNQTVTSDAFSSDALALMAGSAQADPDLDWRPRGDWAAGTLYYVGNIIETGSPATAYVCAVENVASGSFATDYAAGKWVVLSAPRSLISADIVAGLGFTPLNKAGDTMTGVLTLDPAALLAFNGPSSSQATISTAALASQRYLVLSDAGIFVQVPPPIGNINAVVYGFASAVYRTSGANPNYTVGGQFVALANDAAVTSTTWGVACEAWAANNANAALIGIEPSIINQNQAHSTELRGIDVVFKNRADGVTAVAAGLGSNQYNQGAAGLYLSSQQRSTVGEYCGWRYGIQFDEFAIDRDAQGPGIGIDFSKVHYYGGTDPTTAYRMTSAIAMRDFQSILWNRQNTDVAETAQPIRTYFNSVNQRWMLTNTGIERFGIDVATGTIYSNGVPVVSGISLSGNNTWTGTNTFNNTVTVGANLVMNGASRRIQGDFSNPTLSSRTFFQNANINSTTIVGAVPSGTGTDSGFAGFALSDPNNSAYWLFAIGSSAVIDINRSGTGSLVNFALQMGGIAALTVTQARNATFSQYVTRQTGAFMVNKTVDMSIATATPTKITFDTELFDTGGWFSTALNRYVPQIAGKYHLEAAISFQPQVDQVPYIVQIFKNGSVYKQSSNMSSGTGAGRPVSASVSCVADANGTTDFFEVFVLHTAGVNETLSSSLSNAVFFSGHHIG